MVLFLDQQRFFYLHLQFSLHHKFIINSIFTISIAAFLSYHIKLMNSWWVCMKIYDHIYTWQPRTAENQWNEYVWNRFATPYFLYTPYRYFCCIPGVSTEYDHDYNILFCIHDYETTFFFTSNTKIHSVTIYHTKVNSICASQDWVYSSDLM